MALRTVSISGELVLDMHALNNEATEGNQQITRMVNIVDAEGHLSVVNAISGDMMKHIQAAHFQGLALDRRLPLCAGCMVFDANRINADAAFVEALPKRDNAEALDRVISHCAMDDAEGILITAGDRSMPRKSTVEFGWLVGIPDKTRTESYFHVKYDPRSRGEAGGEVEGANVGQAIFYRPASSGVYAAVCAIELARVGYNDLKHTYAVTEDERKMRARAVLESVCYTFVRPEGAHRSTQNPHILDFRGVVSTSSSRVPAPTISALSGPGYRDEIKALATEIGRGAPGSVAVHEFGSLSEFTRVMTGLLADA